MKINFDRFVPHEIGSPSSKITLPGPKTKPKINFWLKTADFPKNSIFGPGSARNKWPAPREPRPPPGTPAPPGEPGPPRAPKLDYKNI